MTEHDTTTDNAETQGTEPDTPESGNSEAAKYRRRLREVEAERDALSGQVDRLRRDRLTSLVADRLVDPDDLERHGTDLADLLDDDGNIDTDHVDAAVASLVDERPHLAKIGRRPIPDPSQGARGRPVVEAGFDTAFAPGGAA